jgi:hypothetical protein
MNNKLFCIPLKARKLDQYLAFAKETLQKPEEYSDMLKRYDIHSAKIWNGRFGEQDYLFVYHDVGPEFEEKMKGWDTSKHPFDEWFRGNIEAVYDASAFAEPNKVLDFTA